MVGELDPSSMLIFFKPTSLAISSPVSNPPVNETNRIAGWVTNMSPISPPLPVTTCNIFFGKPAASNASANNIALTGVSEAGLTIIGLPEAIAGPILWVTKFNGALHGVIAATVEIGNFYEQQGRYLP